jgi:hypothetical protein
VNYSSNMNRVLTKLKTNLMSIDAIEKLTKEVAIGVRASNMRRVHNEGKSVSGSLIGSYSTKPIYISVAKSPRRISPQGKPSGKTRVKKKYGTYSYEDETGREIIKREVIGRETVAVGGKTKFKNGKPLKSRYFGDGYKGFRNKIGRETSIVNLQLTGSLKADFNMVKTNNGWSIGFDKKAEIANGLEKHFNKIIWGVSEQDRVSINQIISNFIKRKL